jgi:MFS family permease
MSLAYSIYGIAQLVGSIALLLLQSWPAAASIRLPTQYTIIVVTVVVALGSTLLMVLAPASYQLLLVARAIQGTMGAVYTIYAMTLLVQWFPPAWQMQAVAFMTAGGPAAGQWALLGLPDPQCLSSSGMLVTSSTVPLTSLRGA